MGEVGGQADLQLQRKLGNGGVVPKGWQTWRTPSFPAFASLLAFLWDKARGQTYCPCLKSFSLIPFRLQFLQAPLFPSLATWHLDLLGPGAPLPLVLSFKPY